MYQRVILPYYNRIAFDELLLPYYNRRAYDCVSELLLNYYNHRVYERDRKRDIETHRERISIIPSVFHTPEDLASSPPTDRTHSLIGLDRQSHDSHLLTHNVWTVFVTGE